MSREEQDLESSKLKMSDYRLYIEFVLKYSEEYLRCGGPVSRLEKGLLEAAQNHGYPSQIFATPLVVIFNVQASEDSPPDTHLRRIDDHSIDLTRLKRLERLWEKFSHGNLSLQAADKLLHRQDSQPTQYPRSLILSAFFLIGVIVTYPVSQSLVAALISGLLCMALHAFSPIMGSRLGIKSFFLEFVMSSFAAISAAVLSSIVGVSSFEMALGVFVALVPGLSLTLAIAEVSSGAIVSGIIRLFRAFLTLLAMALSWTISQEFQLPEMLEPYINRAAPLGFFEVPAAAQGFVLLLGHACLIGCFCILFQSPRKAILKTLLVGLLGVAMHRWVSNEGLPVMASFMGALTIGMFSQFFAKRSRIPSQIYSTPAIIILVPGMLAFSSFQAVGATKADASSGAFLQAFLVAVALVFGLISARIPFRQEFDGNV